MPNSHKPIFSDTAKYLYEENGHQMTKEARFFEWFETPINYKTKKRRHKREQMEEERSNRTHLPPSGPIAQKIMLSIALACSIGLFVLVLY